MRIAIKQIIFGKQILKCCNQRAIYWENQQSLILSDLHLGKSTHFRQNGIAIPQEVLSNDLLRLKQLIHYFLPKQVIVVGDLFHAGKNIEFDIFKSFLKETDIKWLLIKGNHDRLSNEVYHQLNIQTYDRLIIDGILFHHHPIHEQYLPTISGHIHPGTIIKGKGRQRIKLPCYLINEHQLILPAFSLFTGLDTRRGKNFFKLAFTEKEVFEVDNQ